MTKVRNCIFNNEVPKPGVTKVRNFIFNDDFPKSGNQILSPTWKLTSWSGLVLELIALLAGARAASKFSSPCKLG